MASEQQVATACLALINAQLASYGAGDVLAQDLTRDVTNEEVQFTISPRFTASERGGMTDQFPWRITTRPVGRTAHNARELARRVRVALDGVRVVAGGETSTPVHFESADAIDPDDRYFSGLSTWTFVL